MSSIAGDFLSLTPVSVKLVSTCLSDDQEGSKSTLRANSAIGYRNEDAVPAGLTLDQLVLVRIQVRQLSESLVAGKT